MRRPSRHPENLRRPNVLTKSPTCPTFVFHERLERSSDQGQIGKHFGGAAEAAVTSGKIKKEASS